MLKPKYYYPEDNNFTPLKSYITYVIAGGYRVSINYIKYLPTGIQFLHINVNRLNMLPHTIQYLNIDVNGYENSWDKLPIHILMICIWNCNIYNLPPLLKYVNIKNNFSYKSLLYLINTFRDLNKILFYPGDNKRNICNLKNHVKFHVLELIDNVKYENYKQSCYVQN